MQRIGVARHLEVHALVLPGILLDEAVNGLREPTGLLLDQQELPGRPHHGEIDLADDRVVVRLDARPVNAVVDGVAVGEPRGEHFQRAALALGGAGGGELAPAGREDFSQSG